MLTHSPLFLSFPKFINKLIKLSCCILLNLLSVYLIYLSHYLDDFNFKSLFHQKFFEYLIPGILLNFLLLLNDFYFPFPFHYGQEKFYLQFIYKIFIHFLFGLRFHYQERFGILFLLEKILLFLSRSFYLILIFPF